MTQKLKQWFGEEAEPTPTDTGILTARANRDVVDRTPALPPRDRLSVYNPLLSRLSDDSYTDLPGNSVDLQSKRVHYEPLQVTQDSPAFRVDYPNSDDSYHGAVVLAVDFGDSSSNSSEPYLLPDPTDTSSDVQFHASSHTTDNGNTSHTYKNCGDYVNPSPSTEGSRQNLAAFAHDYLELTQNPRQMSRL